MRPPSCGFARATKKVGTSPTFLPRPHRAPRIRPVAIGGQGSGPRPRRRAGHGSPRPNPGRPAAARAPARGETVLDLRQDTSAVLGQARYHLCDSLPENRPGPRPRARPIPGLTHSVATEGGVGPFMHAKRPPPPNRLVRGAASPRLTAALRSIGRPTVCRLRRREPITPWIIGGSRPQSTKKAPRESPRSPPHRAARMAAGDFRPKAIGSARRERYNARPRFLPGNYL